jgi:glycosyltransferase involved in cell wall biosynthesis
MNQVDPASESIAELSCGAATQLLRCRGTLFALLSMQCSRCGRHMKIAQIPPLYESIPPKYYGGTERVVASLCDALVNLGHDVTLFAAGDAKTKARLVTTRDQSIRLDPAALKSDLSAHLATLHEVKRRAAQFDILHFHLDVLHLPMFELHADKCVTTLHGRLDLKDLRQCFERWPGFGLVSVSDSQRRPMPGVNWLATVHNGLVAAPSSAPPPSAKPYLAFLGRISPEKGCDAAIRIAKRAGIPLRIAAKIDNADRAYFDSVIQPLLDDPLIEFVGEIGDGQKAEFLRGARALLFPINWPEPFGLVVIEAMAHGTPVIAYDCGAVCEVLHDGVTGFIVNSEDEALMAIERVGQLDRNLISASFERRFTAEVMARAYLRVYDGLIQSYKLGRAS